MTRIYWLILVALLGFSICCFGQIKNGAYRLMLKTLLSHSVPELGVAAAARDSSSIVFLDAREAREFEVSHLKNAHFVGYDSFDIRHLPSFAPDTRIVVYCSVGYRSEKISEKLIAAGFSNVANLYGGIFEWVNQGYKVYDNQGETLRVHAFDRTWGAWLRRGQKVYK